MYRGHRLCSNNPALPVFEQESGIKPRIHYLSWNVGGLSELLPAELETWLKQADQQNISCKRRIGISVQIGRKTAGITVTLPQVVRAVGV